MTTGVEPTYGEMRMAAVAMVATDRLRQRVRTLTILLVVAVVVCLGMVGGWQDANSSANKYKTIAHNDAALVQCLQYDNGSVVGMNEMNACITSWVQNH